jgi:hypothetical protein
VSNGVYACISSPYRLLGDQKINRVQSIKHLGITYQENGKINIEERLSIGRRTIYALLGPGLHARSGMSPVVLLKTWNTYAVPRYLYGLEIQAYTPLDTKKLEQLQRATCRQFQCLPERTTAVAIYTLIGAEPIETTLDKSAMILFTTLARLDSSIEKDTHIDNVGQRMYSRFSVDPLGTFLILHAVQVLVRHILFVCLYSISLQYLFSRFLGKLFQGA